MDATTTDGDHKPEPSFPVEGIWSFEVRPQCCKCYRLAVVYDDDEKPYCGRHATIFMTAVKGLSTGG